MDVDGFFSNPQFAHAHPSNTAAYSDLFDFYILSELYEPTGENLGEGAFGSVLTYKNAITQQEYAVKVSQQNNHKPVWITHDYCCVLLWGSRLCLISAM